jgi:hypothetical protein
MAKVSKIMCQAVAEVKSQAVLQVAHPVQPELWESVLEPEPIITKAVAAVAIMVVDLPLQLVAAEVQVILEELPEVPQLLVFSLAMVR